MYPLSVHQSSLFGLQQQQRSENTLLPMIFTILYFFPRWRGARNKSGPCPPPSLVVKVPVIFHSSVWNCHVCVCVCVSEPYLCMLLCHTTTTTSHLPPLHAAGIYSYQPGSVPNREQYKGAGVQGVSQSPCNHPADNGVGCVESKCREWTFGKVIIDKLTNIKHYLSVSVST